MTQPDTMSASEYQAMLRREQGLDVPSERVAPKRQRKAKPPAGMTEAALMTAIIEAADALGYLCHHETDSRKSRAGFPDLHVVGHNLHFVFELKGDRGESRPAQRAWIKAYQGAGVDARFVYPEDLDDVLEDLTRGAS